MPIPEPNFVLNGLHPLIRLSEELIASAIAATAFTAPALADFYVVREGAAGACRVVETRPTDTKIVVVGNKVYKTRAEAEKEITVICK